MKRVFLFLAANLAIVVVLSITLRLLGVERILDEQGVGLNLSALLIFAALFGFGGAFLITRPLEVDCQATHCSTGDPAAVQCHRGVVGRDDWTPSQGLRYRHAGGGRLRCSGGERLCHGSPA